MRHRVAAIHRTSGAFLGVLLAWMGLSGATLVLGPDLETLAHPERAAAPPTGPVSVEAAYRAAEPLIGTDAMERIMVPPEGEARVEFWVGPGGDRRLFVDGATSRLLSEHIESRSYIGRLFAWHSQFEQADWRRGALGLVGLGLIGASLAGLYLAWPAIRSRQITARLGTADRAGLIGLHRIAGLLGLVVVATNGVTGAYLALRTPWQNFFAEKASPPSGSAPGPDKANEPIKRPHLDRLLEAADRALPGGRNTIINPPKKHGGQWRVRRRQDAEWHPNGRSSVFIDPLDLSVKKQDDATKAPLVDRILNLAYPLHTWGWRAPWPLRLVHVLCGLALPTLFLTGLLSLRKRFRNVPGRVFT